MCKNINSIIRSYVTEFLENFPSAQIQGFQEIQV